VWVRPVGRGTRRAPAPWQPSKQRDVPLHGSGGPGDRYGRHDHTFHKVLFCLSGSIVFHTAEGDIELTAGDRLDIEPGTSHSATVGPEGCECVEASQES
jgi:hypothetical protein